MGLILLLTGMGGSSVCASFGSLSDLDRAQYSLVASTHTWSFLPENNYRLFVDVYNITDAFDAEGGGDPRVIDLTHFSDTVRPVASLLWGDQFRFQAGIIGQRTLGNSPDFSNVDAWLQVLWKPASAWEVIVGNLNIPHDFLPALFYPENYFLVRNNERGLQLLHDRPGWKDDLYFNERQTDIPSQNEKFDFAFVHHNEWRWFHFTYQSHWIHTGGDNYPHPFNTVNDVAQTAGIGGQLHVLPALLLGLDGYVVHSHYRVDAPTQGLNSKINGNGHYYQVWARWGRLKLTYAYWHGNSYSHEGGDKYFQVPVLRQAIVHWDILVHDDFSLFGEYTGYFVGNNSQHYDHYVNSTFWIQSAWHFALPSAGWSFGTPTAEPHPARWDVGL